MENMENMENITDPETIRLVNDIQREKYKHLTSENIRKWSEDLCIAGDYGDMEKRNRLAKIVSNLQRPSPYYDADILDSPLTKEDYNILETIKRYMNIGYRLAFITPEVEIEIAEKETRRYRSAFKQSEESSDEMKKTLSQYDLEIGRGHVKGTLEHPIYFIDTVDTE